MSGGKNRLQRNKALGRSGNGWYLDYGGYIYIYMYLKTHKIVHFKYGQFTMCNLCLDKVLKHGLRGI